jgi:hypothetical protein
MTCHSKEDEKNATHEAELMISINHRNLVPCQNHAIVPLTGHRNAVSEVLIVMPFYKVSTAL